MLSNTLNCPHDGVRVYVQNYAGEALLSTEPDCLPVQAIGSVLISTFRVVKIPKRISKPVVIR